ncbi:MAG: IS1634 family transposase [Thermoplasmataceae archaeon]
MYEYAQICERYRENGKQKTRILEYLGPVRNEADMERYRKALLLAVEKDSMRRTAPENFSLLPSKEFGVAYAAMTVMNNSGILEILRKNSGVYAHILNFMIIARLLEPSSDLSLINLSEMVYYPWSRLDLNDDNIYRTLDKLISAKDVIEIEIFHALKPDTSIVHYDLTSSYFEGREDNDLVLFGYSRDKKRGKEQIVIGLVMADGIPIHHEVWKGNTVDPKTLETTISALKERFQIKNMILIADRAFGRSKSLDLLDQNMYITAAYRWDQPYRNILMNTDFTGGQVMDGLIINKVTINVDDVMKDDSTEEQRKLAEKRRYIAVYNKKREELDLKDLNDKIDIVRKKISEIQDQKELKKSLGKLKSLVKFTKDDTVLNEKRINVLTKLAGRFLIVTNTDLKGDEVVSAYKEQWQIERSFRTIKTFLEIRPVYHRKSERIRAHVFVCVLSLLLSRLIEKKTKITISEAGRILSYLKVTPVQLGSGVVMIRSESEHALDLLNQMNIPYPERILDGARTKKT